LNRLLLSLLLIGIGIYIYIVLYKYDNEDDEDNTEYQTLYNTKSTKNTKNINNTNNVNNINKLKSILKHHEQELINDNFIEHQKVNHTNTTNTTNTTNSSDKHVHFSEKNDEFVFSANLPIVKDIHNSDLDDIFIKPNFFVEPYSSDHNQTKNINLTLSENEYFSKV
jgi:hypothetical protein